MKNKILHISLVLFSIALFSFKGGKETTYSIDSKSSTLVWTGKKVTGEHKGNIGISSGQLILSNGKLKGGKFELDVAGLTVTDITDTDKNQKLVGHLKNEDFFSTDKFPKATFVISSVKDNGSGNYDITGNLTIKGITKPNTFKATLTTAGQKIAAKAQISVDRTQYDIKYRSSLFFSDLGDKAISDVFTLDVSLVSQ